MILDSGLLLWATLYNCLSVSVFQLLLYR